MSLKETAAKVFAPPRNYCARSRVCGYVCGEKAAAAARYVACTANVGQSSLIAVVQCSGMYYLASSSCNIYYYQLYYDCMQSVVSGIISFIAYYQLLYPNCSYSPDNFSVVLQ